MCWTFSRARMRMTRVVTLEHLREQALQTLAGHYAAGDLRVGTIEHRVEEALAAESPDEMTAPSRRLRARSGRESEVRVSRPPSQRPVSRIVFHAVPEITVAMRGPRTWLTAEAGLARRCCSTPVRRCFGARSRFDKRSARQRTRSRNSSPVAGGRSNDWRHRRRHRKLTRLLLSSTVEARGTAPATRQLVVQASFRRHAGGALDVRQAPRFEGPLCGLRPYASHGP